MPGVKAIPPIPDPYCPGPHYGEGPWPCCQIYAENLPSNESQDDVEILPGWTAQQGNRQAVPLEICSSCGEEFPQNEIHLHTRVTHGYELVITPENRTPHPYDDGRRVDYGH